MIYLPDDTIIEAHALANGLEPQLVKAQVLVESGGNTWAWNPEPAYRYLWDVKLNRPFRQLTSGEAIAKTPPSDFLTLQGDRDQEFWAQQSSWGLLQVMGAVAREVGFNGPFLTELCKPEVGMHVGCLYLARLLKRGGGNIVAALAAYNGGWEGNRQAPYRNDSYVRKVFDARERIHTQGV
jgi:hypothetical protein